MVQNLTTTARNKTQTWRTWSVDTPPVEGAYLTARGWEVPLQGSPSGQTELLVAFSKDYTSLTGNANITSITLPTKGYYIAGEYIDFIVNFNEKVTVTGSPYIQFTAGGSTKNASYTSGSTTASIVFRYTVQAGDLDLDGIVLSSNITLNSGTIVDTSGGAASALTFTGSSYTTQLADVRVFSAAAYSSTTQPGAGAKTTGQNLDVSVVFTQPVVVDTTGGVPTVPLYKNDGTTLIGAMTYLSGSGTSTLVFRRTILVGDNATTACKFGANITLNGGTIKDAIAGFQQNATVTFTQVTLTGVTIN